MSCCFYTYNVFIFHIVVLFMPHTNKKLQISFIYEEISKYDIFMISGIQKQDTPSLFKFN